MSTSDAILKLLASMISVQLPKMEKEVCIGNILIKIGVNQNDN